MNLSLKCTNVLPLVSNCRMVRGMKYVQLLLARVSEKNMYETVRDVYHEHARRPREDYESFHWSCEQKYGNAPIARWNTWTYGAPGIHARILSCYVWTISVLSRCRRSGDDRNNKRLRRHEVQGITEFLLKLLHDRMQKSVNYEWKYWRPLLWLWRLPTR